MASNSPVASSNAETESIVAQEDLPKVGMAGAAIAIVGAFLPWYTLFGESMIGIEGDGIFSLIAGVAAIGLIYARDWDRRTIIGTGVCGGLVAFLGLYHMTSLSGMGVYVTLLGGLVLLAAAGLGYSNVE